MTRVALIAALIALGLGCGGNEPSGDPSRCLPTGEFRNTGCAEVMGLVTDGNGGAVSGAYMRVQGAVDPERQIELVYDPLQSNTDGAYKLRAIRMGGPVPASCPDTVTVWVRALVAPPPGAPAGTPGLSGSSQATLLLRPVGAVPVMAQATTVVVRAS
jgi:hypothetical protein